MNCLDAQINDVLLNNKKISSIGDGEKIVLTQKFDHLLFLSNNFVSAGKIKKGFTGFGKKVEIISSSRETEDEDDRNLMPFVEALNKYICNEIDCLIFLPNSAMTKFDLKKFCPFSLKESQQVQLTDLITKLSNMGYERTSIVESQGQFSVRGEILDIFISSQENPIRIEFFDDLIEKIYVFDPISMKNIEKKQEIAISLSNLPFGENDIFDLEGTKIIDEPKKIEEEITLLEDSYKVMSFYNKNNYQKFENLYKKADYIFDNFDSQNADYENTLVGERNYLTDFLALKQDLLNLKEKQISTILFTGEERFLNKMQDFLKENGIKYSLLDENQEIKKGEIYVSSLYIPYTFSFLKEKVVGIGCENLFLQKKDFAGRKKHEIFYLPKLGDYVVHSFHGIGKCIKIERLKISDIEKDYFVIEYKNNDILYLPSEEANTISAYIGSEENPKLSSLGGAEFTRLKERVKASIKEMAISLLEIYKERNEIKGFKFKRDDYLDKKFADSFGYSETPDQAKAISDIEKDMESDKVMDRLICGDVGFGKTEVALRACFKCVYNGKQVAFLCPTTILSEQHYRTTKERLSPFGVKVEVLNRFKTPSQTKEILQKLKDGEIDVIIGTHRLLSGDVSYKDLGLLILDEEQRFGVEHKEKIKDKNRLIDVLTLSATPIPRTLNMSLSGIRDISIIDTPPKDRLPVQTYLADENEQLIKDVLSREMQRKGQSFIVYNRVESIDNYANYIRTLIPNAKVGVAHGQMNEKVLEDVISKVYNGEYNILVSTTLIENGIDLPSANTMIVVDADRLGLSQLYQLRGRIGRSDKLGYAYLLYNKNKTMTDEAYKRLEAIKEFSMLGSGFKIAIRDLEIRGAGNIFGKEQHGHIAKVGYDMFVKLLDEQVKELKGEKLEKKNDVKLEISLSAYIDENYVADSEQRIIYYSKISDISSREEMQDLLKSLHDGFGEVPNETKNLCLIAYMRNLASKFNIEKIRVNKEENIVFLKKIPEIIDENLSKALSSSSGKLTFDSTVKIKFNVQGSMQEKINEILKLLEEANKS